MDQAQHFGALGAAAGGAAEGQSGKEFREGLDATERERRCPPSHARAEPDGSRLVFGIAQESAKQSKLWYESTDKPRRL